MANLSVAGLILCVVLLAGCSDGIPGLIATGSGRPVTRELALDGFDTIEAGSAFSVDIKQGEGFQVSITADDNFIDHVRATRDGTVLRLSLDPAFAGVNAWKLGTLQARITMPDLRELRLSGAAQGVIDGFTHDVNARLSGASWLRGSLAAGSLELDASGASNASVDGSAQELTLSGSGASHLDLHDLRAGNARVNLSGASSARVNVLGQLDYEVSGGSHLDYLGRPRIGETAVSGGGSVENR